MFLSHCNIKSIYYSFVEHTITHLIHFDDLFLLMELILFTLNNELYCLIYS